MLLWNSGIYFTKISIRYFYNQTTSEKIFEEIIKTYTRTHYEVIKSNRRIIIFELSIVISIMTDRVKNISSNIQYNNLTNVINQNLELRLRPMIVTLEYNLHNVWKISQIIKHILTCIIFIDSLNIIFRIFFWKRFTTPKHPVDSVLYLFHTKKQQYWKKCPFSRP